MKTYNDMPPREAALRRALDRILLADPAYRPGHPDYMSKAQIWETARLAVHEHDGALPALDFAYRIGAIRQDLRQLCADLQADRDAATGDTKTALRKANNRLEHADAQLRFAEQDATK